MTGIRRLPLFLLLAAGLYLLASGLFLTRIATRVLTVGQLAAALGAGEAPGDPMTLGYRGDPMAALSLPFETVTVPTPLGPAPAWLVPGPTGTTRNAIYVHGIAGAREDGYRHLGLLHRAGYNVLLISYRNDPGAPAAPDGLYAFGLTEWQDLDAAVTLMRARAGAGSPLLIVAESMGGAILGQFLRQSPQADAVGAIALDSPAISFAAVIGHVSAATGLPFPGGAARVARRLLPLTTGLDLAGAETAAAFAVYPGPLFLAHGRGDRIVPFAPSAALAAARTAPTATFWTGADHLQSFAADPAGYAGAFDRFLSLVPG